MGGGYRLFISLLCILYIECECFLRVSLCNFHLAYCLKVCGFSILACLCFLERKCLLVEIQLVDLVLLLYICCNECLNSWCYMEERYMVFQMPTTRFYPCNCIISDRTFDVMIDRNPEIGQVFKLLI